MIHFRHVLCLAAVCTAVLATRTAAAFPEEVEVVVTTTGPSEFWIGLATAEISDQLKAHVDLPEGQGIIVREVYPDSAAEKSKLRIHDILLKAGDTKLKSPYDLARAVQAANDKSLTLKVMRKGETSSIEVTPQKRPAVIDTPQRAQRVDEALKQFGADHSKLYEEILKQNKGLRLLMVEPGQVVPKNWRSPVATGLPNGVSVSITRTNDEPAKIKVTRGKESWEVTENDLDKLPEDIRPSIQRMLDGNNHEVQFRVRQPILLDRSADAAGAAGGGGGPGGPRIVTRVERGTNVIDADLKKLAEEIRRLAGKIEKLEKQQRDK